MLPETIYCYEINFIVTSKSRALMKQLIVMDQLWHLVRMVTALRATKLMMMATITTMATGDEDDDGDGAMGNDATGYGDDDGNG